MLKPNERISYLKTLYQRAKRALESGNAREYERLGESVYEKLREAWESAVEDVLLHGTVKRYVVNVHTGSLQDVEIAPDDHPRIEAGMSKCQRWCHNPPAAAGIPFPSPAAIEADIKALESFIDDLKKRAGNRRKQREAARKTDVG